MQRATFDFLIFIFTAVKRTICLCFSFLPGFSFRLSCFWKNEIQAEKEQFCAIVQMPSCFSAGRFFFSMITKYFLYNHKDQRSHLPLGLWFRQTLMHTTCGLYQHILKSTETQFHRFGSKIKKLLCKSKMATLREIQEQSEDSHQLASCGSSERSGVCTFTMPSLMKITAISLNNTI